MTEKKEKTTIWNGVFHCALAYLLSSNGITLRIFRIVNYAPLRQSLSTGTKRVDDGDIIIIIIILLKFKLNRFSNLHSPHIASLIEAGCVTYNKIHNKHITSQIHYIIIKFRKYIYIYHYQNQVNK